MRDINIILEGVCMDHINRNSRLSEAVDKAIKEDTIEVLSEAVGRTILEAADNKVSIKDRIKSAWAAMKRFLFTIVTKVSGFLDTFRNDTKKDMEYYTKNKEAILNLHNTYKGDAVINNYWIVKKVQLTGTEVDGVIDALSSMDVTNKEELEKDFLADRLYRWSSCFGIEMESEKDLNQDTVFDRIFENVRLKNNWGKYVFDESQDNLNYINAVAKYISEYRADIINAERKTISMLEKKGITEQSKIDIILRVIHSSLSDTIKSYKVFINALVRNNKSLKSFIKKALA